MCNFFLSLDCCDRYGVVLTESLWTVGLLREGRAGDKTVCYPLGLFVGAENFTGQGTSVPPPTPPPPASDKISKTNGCFSFSLAGRQLWPVC